jgi:mannose-6-phosphate isomerase-like protein (cupin superfamily)
MAVAIVMSTAGCAVGPKKMYRRRTSVIYAPTAVASAHAAVTALPWQQYVRDINLGPDDNIRVVTLGKTDQVSHHIALIRDREPYHIHKNHDLTVSVLNGTGSIVIEGTRYPCEPGTVIFIPRGTAHAYINGDKRFVSAAFVVFSPPFDGKDRIVVEEQSTRD